LGERYRISSEDKAAHCNVVMADVRAALFDVRSGP
jgi:hypothetical protein